MPDSRSPHPLRVVATGGGTAGHVHPALAVVRALQQSRPGVEVLYLGTRGSMEEEIVLQAGLRMGFIASGALRGRAPWTLAWNTGKMLWGFGQSLVNLRRFRPAAVLATGGYSCVPAVVAARACRVPVLLYLPDLRPGMAVSSLARLANQIAITAAEAAPFLPKGKTVVSGYPVRPELRRPPKDEARRNLGLPIDQKTILVVGGSRGARTLNLAVGDSLARWVELGYVIHSCGQDDLPAMLEKKQRLPEKIRERYKPYPYLGEEMAWALSAADLAISRSGASTLGELPAFALPSILVPYPYAGMHQRWNAEYLVKKGAAVMLYNSEVQEGKLLPVVEEILSSPDRWGEMVNCARALAQPDAAEKIAREVLALAERG